MPLDPQEAADAGWDNYRDYSRHLSDGGEPVELGPPRPPCHSCAYPERETDFLQAGADLHRAMHTVGGHIMARFCRLFLRLGWDVRHGLRYYEALANQDDYHKARGGDG